jgi:hypothetical protein
MQTSWADPQILIGFFCGIFRDSGFMGLARLTDGNGREEKLVPGGPDSKRKTSRLPPVLPLPVSKEKNNFLVFKTQQTRLTQQTQQTQITQ